MKLETAIKVLVKRVEFLGFKNLGELVADIEQQPLAYPLSATTAYKVYKEEGFK
jgi:hypothetical protein